MRSSKFVLIVLLVLLVGSLSRAPASHAATFTVNSTDDAVDAAPGDGMCASAAGTCTLRAAIQETNALAGPDTINLPTGTYTLTIPGDGEDLAGTGDLDVTDDLTVNGDGPTSTIIDGNGLDRVLHIQGLVSAVNVSGVTVRNGDTSSGGGGIFSSSNTDLTLTDSIVEFNRAHSGGGISHHGSGIFTNVEIRGNSAAFGAGISNNNSLTLTNSMIDGNTADFDGGGIHNQTQASFGSVTLINTVVKDNSANFGGGVFNSDGEVLITTNSEVSNNQAVSGGGVRNGDMSGAGGTTVVKDSAINDNRADDVDGGGIDNINGSVTLTNSVVNGNSAGRDGGGIDNLRGEVILTNCSINRNSALKGGGILNTEGTVEIANSTIAYNTAGDGGGLYNWGTMTLVNSTISGNDASTGGGGGIFNNTAGLLELINNTISQNSAIQNGGGILNGDTAQLINTIVADNLPGEDCAGNPVVSNGHNLDSDDTCNLTQPTDLPGMSPLLGPLQNNGGPTETYALPTNSPAIDTADNATCAASPVNNLDQRGQLRPVDGDEDGIAVCDIGAYELQLGDCVEFEDPTLGTEYQVGDTFVDSWVTISADTFFWSDGTPFDGGFARIENTGLAGGAGQEIAVNNINLAFDFGVPLIELELRFGEYGGNLNINVNGDFRNFENFVEIDGQIIGGVEVSVVNGLGNDTGLLTLKGTINSFAIGGQELWIDDVCPLAGGQISIVKETIPGGATGFTFAGDLGTFTLDDGGIQVSSGLPPGDYDVIETRPTGWDLDSVVCTGGDSDPIADGVTIHLDAGEEITCTFTNEQTTAIELSLFTAQASADSVTVAWETAAEIDNEGFNLWRAEAADGEYTQVNPSLIPAQGNPDSGASYEYTDRDVIKGVTYYYKLEDVDIHGVSTFHGPVSARPSPISPIYLPLIFSSSPLASHCDRLETRGQLLSAAAESALRAICAEGKEGAETGSRQGLTPEIEAEARALLASPAIQVNAPDLAPPHPDQTTQSETAIAVAGDKVVVGWNDSSELVDLPNTSFSGYAFSTTGGASFTDGGPIPPRPVGPPDFPFDGYAVALGDPDITVDSAGNFYYSSLTFVCPADGVIPDDCTDSFIGVWKSIDGGATFTGPTLVRGTGSDMNLGYLQDKPLITADTTGGPFSESIYVSWTELDPDDNTRILFSRSTDSGLTFAPAIPVTPLNGETDTVVQGSFPEVGPDGEIYVAWEEGWPVVADRSIRIRRSVSGGTTFPGPDIVINASVNTIGSAENCGTVVQPSIRETLPGSIRSQEFPSIDVDHSGGPFDGNVYAVWNSDPDGEAGPDNADIFFSRSTNGGNTWSPPLVVNDDGTNTNQFFPFVRVTQAGTVAVMWYDRRLNGSDIDVFKAFSVDGGQTFEPNIRVTDVSFAAPPINPNFDPAVLNCYMAEYNHMATQGSTLYLTWGDNRKTLFTPDFPNGRADPDVFFETESDPAVLNLVLTPDTATNEVDTPHTVVATVTDGLGNPISGLAIEFTVTGANTASGSGTTDATGQASFTYTGTNEGDDTITAWVDRDGDGVQDPDEASDTAVKTWKPVTAIVLVSFTASGQDGQILLEWETVSEIDNEGFNIWRSEAGDGEYTRLNPSLIPAQGNPDTGASYQFIDSEVVNGMTYYYQLEDVDLRGVSTFHGPVSAVPSP